MHEWPKRPSFKAYSLFFYATMQQDQLNFLFKQHRIARRTNVVGPLPLEGKRVLVILDELRSDGDIEQIEKIFAACQLRPDQLLVTDQKVSFAQVSSSDSLQEIFLFNVASQSIGINYQLFAYRFMNVMGKKVVQVDGLSTIMTNKELKEHFWKNCLQPYYLSQK